MQYNYGFTKDVHSLDNIIKAVIILIKILKTGL